MAKPTMGRMWLLILILTFSYCGGPQLLAAQTTAGDSSQAAQPEPGQQPPSDNQGIVNPAQGPLAPVPSTQATTPEPPPAEATTPETPAPQKAPERPEGAAVGEAGKTAGGPASRPAGNALAPAKQRQTRSLLIKIGVIAAAGLAVGTVAALTHGTPSKPPGAK
jgi:cytoskeletal protein RodZ